MQVSLIRHGKAEYNNITPTRDRETATDIIPSTLDELRLQAQNFVSRICPEDTVTIWSSPIPRAIETSRIFEEVLISQGKRMRKTALFDAFEEARGFKFAYLNVLVNGGFIEFADKKIEVDPCVTNPHSLTLGQYFRESAWSQIPHEALAKLGEFWWIIQKMELYTDIVKRVTQSLRRLENISNKNHHLLIFTHQCCTDFVIEAVNGYSRGGINPGDSVTLQIQETGIRILDTPFGAWKRDILLTTSWQRVDEILLKT